MSNQLTLGAEFDGSMYDPEIDRARLSGQLLEVYDALIFLHEYSNSLFEWATVEELCALLEAKHQKKFPAQSISAQLRNLRKEKFGGLDVRSRYREGARIAEYKLFIGGENG